MHNETQMLTSAETCAALTIDRSTLSRWVASGRIRPAMKMPGLRGAFVFARSEVERVASDLRSAAS